MTETDGNSRYLRQLCFKNICEFQGNFKVVGSGKLFVAFIPNPILISISSSQITVCPELGTIKKPIFSKSNPQNGENQ